MTPTISGIAHGGRVELVTEIHCAGGSDVVVTPVGDAIGLQFELINPNGIPCGGFGGGHFKLDGHSGVRSVMVWADPEIVSKAYEVRVEYMPGRPDQK